MTIDERMDRLTGIVESLAASVVAHDNQIEGLITVAERHDARMRRTEKNLAALIAALGRGTNGKH